MEETRCNTKFITWSKHHTNPFIRIPLPSGRYITKTIVHEPHSDKDTTTQKCINERDRIGIELWGHERWADILRVSTRSVAKHRTVPASDHTGVNHQYRGSKHASAWAATWYEPILDENGEMTEHRKKRSKWYSYGTPRAKFRTSEEAYNAALEKRIEEERKWYTVVFKNFITGSFKV